MILPLKIKVNYLPAKPEGFFGERLEGAGKTVSRPRRLQSSPLPLTKGGIPLVQLG